MLSEVQLLLELVRQGPAWILLYHFLMQSDHTENIVTRKK